MNKQPTADDVLAYCREHDPEWDWYIDTELNSISRRALDGEYDVGQFAFLEELYWCGKGYKRIGARGYDLFPEPLPIAAPKKRSKK